MATVMKVMVMVKLSKCVCLDVCNALYNTIIKGLSGVYCLMCMLSFAQAWHLTHGTWTTTHRCFRGLKETPLVWSALTWPSPTGRFVCYDQISRTPLCRLAL